MIPHGVRLEPRRGVPLKNGIVRLPGPEPVSAPQTFAPLKKNAGPSRILAAAEKAGIVDESDGMPLGKKLSRLARRGPGLLIARCFDEDPCTSSARAVFREDAEKVAAGLKLAARACGVEEKRLAVASRGEARRLRGLRLGIPAVVAGRRYPAGILLMRKLCRNGGRAAFLGAQACAALADAAREGKPQSETVVTVAGDGVRRPVNCRVRIGTPVEKVLRLAKPEEDVRIAAVGSAVAGRTVRDLSLPVTAATRCVIALRDAPPERRYPCIRCGRCARACPAGVVPWLVYRELESGDPDPLLFFHAGDCAGCRACNAVCPSGIDLAAEVRRAAARKEGGEG